MREGFKYIDIAFKIYHALKGLPIDLFHVAYQINLLANLRNDDTLIATPFCRFPLVSHN